MTSVGSYFQKDVLKFRTTKSTELFETCLRVERSDRLPVFFLRQVHPWSMRVRAGRFWNSRVRSYTTAVAPAREMMDFRIILDMSQIIRERVDLSKIRLVQVVGKFMKFYFF